MGTHRSLEQIQYDIIQPSLLLSEKVALLIEWYMVEKNCDWYHLSYRLQFLPFFVKYFTNISDMCYINSCVPYGGFTEYPKSDVHTHIDQKYFPRTLDFSRDMPTDPMTVCNLLEERDFGFPCFVKREKGERGVGVVFCPDLQSAKGAVESCIDEGEHFTIQESARGTDEYCVQFYMIGGRWRVRSVTHRDIPKVVGNGGDTVAQLIKIQLLNTSRVTNDQYTRIVESLNAEYPVLLETVPGDGESVQVVMKASIDFGTIYTYMYGNLVEDLMHTNTPDQWLGLENTINDILGPLRHKLDVGRFDLKANGIEGLQAGEVQIIEVNAGGAIPTHVYIPGIPMQTRIQEVSAHFDWIVNLVEERKKTQDIVVGVRDRIAFYRAMRRSVKKKGVPLSDILAELRPILILYAKSIRMKYEKLVGDILDI